MPGAGQYVGPSSWSVMWTERFGRDRTSTFYNPIRPIRRLARARRALDTVGPCADDAKRAMTRPSPDRPAIPRRLAWLMNGLGAVVLVWTGYVIYAWCTHSGIWALVSRTLASLQPARPSAINVAFIAWGVGLAVVFLVGWPLARVLRRRALPR